MARTRQVDYAELLRFRVALRKFERWSAEQARAANVTPAQHQLLLCIQGHPDPAGPTISDAAEYLLLRHHSVVELVDRAAAAGLVERWSDETDARIARIRLTSRGADTLRELSESHLEEIRRLAHLLDGIISTEPG
jgi:DNA-binding MarR family transcriptional regulator